MKRPTKLQLGERNICNSHNVCTSGGGKVYIDYRAWDSVSRCSSAWLVHGIGFETDPAGSHFSDHGSKSFGVWGRDVKAVKLKHAKAWASERYGIDEWERDPFGGWQDKRVWQAVMKGSQ